MFRKIKIKGEHPPTQKKVSTVYRKNKLKQDNVG